MDTTESIIISNEVLALVDMFDCLGGRMQLELLGILMEKLENEEIILNGKAVTPEDVGIDDAFSSCAIMLDMISRE